MDSIAARDLQNYQSIYLDLYDKYRRKDEAEKEDITDDIEFEIELIKQVEIKNNGQMDTYLFFYMSGTKWDDLITNDDIFSEYVLCSADKGAENIDRVFYYTGDYTGIESMDIGNLQKIIDNSVLLWRK